MSRWLIGSKVRLPDGRRGEVVSRGVGRVRVRLACGKRLSVPANALKLACCSTVQERKARDYGPRPTAEEVRLSKLTGLTIQQVRDARKS